MKKILVGTDGSPSSMKAVAEAAKLASAVGAELHIASAVRMTQDICGLSPLGVAMPGDWAEQAHADASAAVARAADVASKVGSPSEGQVLTGEAAAALIAFAHEIDADLLVLGNKGMQGAARFLLGSVPNRCAHHSPCSVMIVRTA